MGWRRSLKIIRAGYNRMRSGAFAFGVFLGARCLRGLVGFCNGISG